MNVLLICNLFVSSKNLREAGPKFLTILKTAKDFSQDTEIFHPQTNYNRDEGVAFRLAILDKRRLCRFEVNII